jgi:hypothetical protein
LVTDAPIYSAFLLMLKTIIMKAKTNDFFYIEELNTYVKLSAIESFKLESPIKTYGDSLTKCCIITNKSIYWCDKSIYHQLSNIFNTYNI